jgi:hypothetical protein
MQSEQSPPPPAAHAVPGPQPTENAPSALPEPPESAEPSDESSEQPGPEEGGGLRRALRNPGLVATATWLVTLPVAFQVPSVLELNPFTQRGAELPLAACFWAVLVLVAVGLRWRGPVVIGVIAGTFASYVALVLRTGLSGRRSATRASSGTLAGSRRWPCATR